jgi:hypothetical protein
MIPGKALNHRDTEARSGLLEENLTQKVAALARAGIVRKVL